MATRLSDYQRWMLRDILSGDVKVWPDLPGGRRTVESLIRHGYVVATSEYHLALTEEGKDWLRRWDSRMQRRGT